LLAAANPVVTESAVVSYRVQ